MFTPLFLSPTPSPASAAAILDFDPFVTALDSPPPQAALEAEPKGPVNNRTHRAVGVQTEKASRESPANVRQHRTLGVQADMNVRAPSEHSVPEPNHPPLPASSSTLSSLPSSAHSNPEIVRKRPADQGTASESPSNRRRIERHTHTSRIGGLSPPHRARGPSQADSTGYMADCSAFESPDSSVAIVPHS